MKTEKGVCPSRVTAAVLAAMVVLGTTPTRSLAQMQVVPQEHPRAAQGTWTKSAPGPDGAGTFGGGWTPNVKVVIPLPHQLGGISIDVPFHAGQPVASDQGTANHVPEEKEGGIGGTGVEFIAPAYGEPEGGVGGTGLNPGIKRIPPARDHDHPVEKKAAPDQLEPDQAEPDHSEPE